MLTNTTHYTAHTKRDRVFFVLNVVVSIAVVSLIAWMLLREHRGQESALFGFMPAVNAMFNTISAACLMGGFIAIRRDHRDAHRRWMISAFVASSCFLIGYVLYHTLHGDTLFTGVGVVRTVYFALLISHILLSVVVFPLVLSTLYFAARQRFETHRKIARVTFPLWLYVSVSGVIIFFMLHG